MIAIDPGLTGGIAKIDQAGYVTVVDIPTMEKPGKTKIKKMVDAQQLSYILDELMMNDHEHVVIEAVASMSSQGVASVFSLGHTLGTLYGVAAALGAKVEFVSPQVWKKHFNLIGTEKHESIERAKFMFPEIAHKLTRKKDHNRSDAILICQYAIETYYD